MSVRLLRIERGKPNRSLQEQPLSDSEDAIDRGLVEWVENILAVETIEFVNLAELVTELQELHLSISTDQDFFKRAGRRTEYSDIQDWILFTTSFSTLSILIRMSVRDALAFQLESGKKNKDL